MKITISNLGLIKNAQIELKPFTVFLGENGTSKTWVAYTIAGLLGHYGRIKYLEAYLNNKTVFKFQPLEDAIQALSDKGFATIDVRRFVTDHLEGYINEVARLIPEWLGRFLATRSATFKDTAVTVEVSPSTMEKFLENLRGARVIKTTHSIKGKDSSLLVLKMSQNIDSDELRFYIAPDSKDMYAIPEPIKREGIRRFVTETLFNTALASIFTNTPIFPTERATLTALAPFGPAKNDRSDVGSHNKIGPGQQDDGANNLHHYNISEPVRYFLALIHTAKKRYFERKEEIQESPRRNDLIKLAAFLEENILLGKVDFEDHEGGSEILHTPTGSKSLEVTVSSSMVKGLSSLALYLKYLAHPSDIVIIDEPEMNLHPAAQAELTEFMGMLVHSGLYLLITTHSPYIVDHLTNLMKAADVKDDPELKKHFYLEREEAFISKDLVSVYLFDHDGQVKSMVTEDGLIDWDTFGDVSREIAGIYSHIA